MSAAREHDAKLTEPVSHRYVDATEQIRTLITTLRNLGAVARTAMAAAQVPALTVPNLRPYAEWADKVREYLEGARTIPDKTWRQMESPEAWLKDQEPEK